MPKISSDIVSVTALLIFKSWGWDNIYRGGGESENANYQCKVWGLLLLTILTPTNQDQRFKISPVSLKWDDPITNQEGALFLYYSLGRF